MRSLLATAFFVCFSLGASAQEEFAPLGASWYYHLNTINQEGMFGYLHLTASQDTIVDDQQCKLISRSSYDPFNGFLELSPEILCQEQQQVYWKTGGDSWLLFDFALEAGDSWYLSEADNLVMYVDSTQFKTINDQELKFMHCRLMQNEMGISFSGTFIERVGWTQYMLPIFGDQWLGPLRCYSDELFGEYLTGAAPECEFTSGSLVSSNLAADTEDPLEIYPNLVQQMLHFSSSIAGRAWLEVFDLSGQIWLQKTMELFGSEAELALGRLPSGIYFLRLHSDSESPKTARFIKL